MLHYLYFSLDILRKVARARPVRPSTQPLRVFSSRWVQQARRHGHESSRIKPAGNCSY